MNFFDSLSEKAKEEFFKFTKAAGSAAHKVADVMTGKNYRDVVGAIVYKETDMGRQYLLLKKPRKENSWQFPQGGVDDGETHIIAAKRELQEECGDIDVHVENTKVGEYSYDFPTSFGTRDGATGARVSFYMGEYIDGEVTVDGQEIIDHVWVPRWQIRDYVSPTYWDRLKGFIPA